MGAAHRTSTRTLTGAVAVATLCFGLLPVVAHAADDDVRILSTDDPTLTYDAPGVQRNYILTMVDDPMRVVAESGWTTDPTWTAPSGLVEAGALYDGYVLVDPAVSGGGEQYPRTDEDGTFDGTYLYRAPVAFDTTVASGPIRVQIPAGSNELTNGAEPVPIVDTELVGAAGEQQVSLANNGLRARFWPHFADERVDDEEHSHLLSDGTMPMASPQWGIAPTVTEGDRKFWIVRSTPDGWGPEGPPEDPFDYVGGMMMIGFEGMGWAVVEFGRELGLNIGYAGCEAVSWIGNKLFGTKKMNCGDDLNRDVELEFDVMVDFEYLDDGGHVLFNTTGTAVESAGEYIVGTATSSGDGFEHDWSEEMVGNFPLLSAYSTKMLGYLEVDPDHPLVDDDGTIELTFGVQGPAGAQAYLHDVGASDLDPGQRVTLGGADAMAAAPLEASASAATWTIHPSEFALHPGETERSRDARLYRAGVGQFEDQINALAEELGHQVLDTPPMDAPDFGEPVRFNAGEPYPLTMLAWAAFNPGSVGLYYQTDDDGGYAPVPLEWLTPAAPGTLGFNEPSIADGQLELLDDTVDYALSADGSRFAELTAEGLSTARVLPNMELDRAAPITAGGARLGTITYSDLDADTQFPNYVGLDKRVAVDGSGTTVVATADTLDGALAPEVVVASIPNPGVPFDDEHATVTMLSGILDDAGSAPLRTQDGTLASRHVAITADGNHIAVSELWLRDADFGNMRALPANTDSRILLFANGSDGWQLQSELQPTGMVDLDDAVAATTVDAAHLWVAVKDSTAILKIDASTGATLAVFDAAIETAAMVTDGVDLVVIDDVGSAAVLDVDTGTVVRTLALDLVTNPSDAALIGDELFVANAGDGTNSIPLLVTFDVDSGAVRSVAAPNSNDHTRNGNAPDIVVDDLRYVWASSPALGTVVRYDPVDGSTQDATYSTTISGLAFDGDDILVVNDDVVSYPIDDPVGGPVDQWYRADLAFAIDADTMERTDPVRVRSAVPFTSMEAFTADPISAAGYAVMRIDDTPAGRRLVVVDTTETLGSLRDDSQWFDMDTMPLITGRSIAYELDLGNAPTIDSLDLVDGQVWIGSGTSLRAQQPMPWAIDNGLQGLGLAPDAFAASIDIAPSPNGVRIATTTQGGIAVYEFADDHVSKSLAMRTYNTSVLGHQSTLAFTDDGSLLLHSDPGNVNGGGAGSGLAPGQLGGYREMGGYWHEDFVIVAPFDDTGPRAQPFGGKIDVNGRFLTVAGRNHDGDGADVWLFRDPYGDWRSLRTWNPLQHPNDLLDDPGTGSLVNTAGGRFWSQPLALSGHRSTTTSGWGTALYEQDTEHIEAIVRYTRFS